jgi:hypothetical protein
MIYLALGTQLFVSRRPIVMGVPCDLVEVHCILSIGEVSEAAQPRAVTEVDHQMDTERVRLFAGEVSVDSIVVTCLWDDDDEGQQAAFAAFRDKGQEYGFKLVRPSGSVVNAIGPMMSHSIAGIDGPNSPLTRKFSFAPNDLWEPGHA